MTQRVLLCCITPDENRSHEISNQLLFQYFSQFGNVKDTHIFEKNVLIKAFIEFNDAHSMETAFAKCREDKPVFGSIKVYLSSKPSINRSVGKLSTTNQPTSLDEHGLMKMLKTQPQSNVTVYDKISALSFHDRISLGLISKPNPDNFFENADPNSNTHNFSLSKLSQLQSNAYETTDTQQLYQTTDNNQSQKSTTGKVVIANRVTNKILLPHLVHLFSCYGVVDKVLFNRESNYGLIEFKTHQQAKVASECLKNVKIFGTQLKVKLSKYDFLKFKSIEKEKNERLEHFYVNPTEFPKKWSENEEVLHPTNFLKISFCPKELTFVLLQELFRQYHEPENIIVNKEKNMSYCTYIVGFKDVNHAVDIMAVFDNQLVDNGRLVITFVNQTAR